VLAKEKTHTLSSISLVCEAEIQNLERLSVIRVAGKPTLTEATPRLISSRDVALFIQ
jgi:hypothetical protein